MTVVADLGAQRRQRLRAARLYVVSGARQVQRDLDGFLDAILGAGADIVQLREKDAEASSLLRWAEVFSAAARRHGALFIVNDRPDVALAAGADGVHLGQDDIAARWARRILGDDAIIGLSTHSPQQFDAAPQEVDYACVGPVHETPTKPGRAAAGLELVRHAASRSAAQQRPWFAIGGIDPPRLGDVIAAGARRVAVVRAVGDAVSPEDATRQLRSALAVTSGGAGG